MYCFFFRPKIEQFTETKYTIVFIKYRRKISRIIVLLEEKKRPDKTKVLMSDPPKDETRVRSVKWIC